MAVGGLKMAVLVLGLLAMVQQTMQLRITHPVPTLPEDDSPNPTPPYLALLLASDTNEKVLNESDLFVSYYYSDIAGRRFHVGTLGGVPVVYALTGALSADAAATTQLVLDHFPIRGIVHVGSALTLDTDSLPVGSVSVVKSVAFTGFWRWKTLPMPRSEELEASKKQLRFGDFSYPNQGYNYLGAIVYDPVAEYSPEYTSDLKSKFWHDIDAEFLEVAAKGLKDVELKKCYNETHCLSTDPEIKYGLKASTSDIYIQNGAYGSFLHSKFGVATADRETANVILTAKANGVPAIVFRAASSSLTAYDSSFSYVASYNAVLVANKFVGLFPVPRAAHTSNSIIQMYSGMTYQCPGKNSWPKLVGKNGRNAAAVIERENKNVRAIVLLEGTPVTKDFRCDRVRVWVNKRGVVIRVPRVG